MRDRLFTINKWNKKRIFWKGGTTPTGPQNAAANTAASGAAQGAGGGGVDIAGAVTGIGGAVTGIANTAISNAQIDDEAVQAEQGQIDENRVAQASASSYDTLLSQWTSWKPQDQVSWKDIRGSNAGDAAMSAFGAAAQGASAGAALGPIGAAAGAVLGGLASGIGSGIGRRKAKKKAAELNRQILQANRQRVQTFALNAENIDANVDKAASTGFLAEGGYLNTFKDGGGIHIKPENRGKFTALKKRTGKSASWFKEHGTPAQKKMATFALNARKWKHDDGGWIDASVLSGYPYGDYIAERINKMELNDAQKAAVYSSLYGESRFNPYAFNPGGGGKGAHGIMQWRGDRIPESNYLPEQMDYLESTLKSVDRKNWLSKKSLKKFKEANTPEEASKALESGYVRGEKFSRKAKSDNARKVYDAIYKPNLFDIIGANTREVIQPNIQIPFKSFNEGGSLGLGITGLIPGVGTITKGAKLAKAAKAAEKSSGGFLDNIYGGVFSNGVTEINNGGTHEENPNEGVQLGMDSEGIPNLVEEGEVVWNDYVFSNRLTVPKDFRKSLGLNNKKNLTFAEAANSLNKEGKERPNDPISKDGLTASLSRLRSTQEIIRNSDMKKKYKKPNRFDYGGDTDGLFTYINNAGYYPESTGYFGDGFEGLSQQEGLGVSPAGYNIKGNTPEVSVRGLSTDSNGMTTLLESGKKQGNKKGLDLSALRYMPAIGSAIQALVGNRPDYENADMIGRAANSLSMVKAAPVGNYLSYNPMDRNYYINKLNANAAATRRTMANLSGGSAAAARAGILASDYKAQLGLGNLARQAEEYNLAQRERVQNFNRATNMYNSESALKADMANQAQERARLEAKITQAQMRENIKRATEEARGENLTNFFDNIGNIGWEAYNRNMVNSNRALYYGTDGRGNSYYKGSRGDGGYLTINRKKKRRK